MKRKFIFKNNTSNKFWIIESNQDTQTVRFGKVGTKGRENTKIFTSEENCLKDSLKLIGKKLKKGYTETLTKENILKDDLKWDLENNDAIFWDIIEEANQSISTHWSDYSIDEHLENLTILLSKFNKDQIVLFQKCFVEKLNELYIGNTAELYIILTNSFQNIDGQITFDNYISTDGYIYFRCWLVLKGKAFFNDIKDDINSFISGKYSFDIGDTWAEGLLYVSDEAYSYYHEDIDEFEISDLTSQLFPEVIHYDDMDKNHMDREFYGGKDLGITYPELVKTLCDLRS